MLLGVSLSTVQTWVESGVLQAWKTSGGHRRVLRSSVDSLLHKSAQGDGLIAPPPHEAEPVADPSGPLRVFVVEDDENLLRLYQVKIASWPIKCEFQGFGTAVAALVEIGRRAPDILITDLRLPGMDGISMIQEIRKMPHLSTMSIVVVTGMDASAMANRGGLPDDIEILTKPVAFDRLLAVASEHLAHRLNR